MSRNNVFAGGELDRAAPRRSDAAWVAAHRANPDSRYVALWRGLCLIDGGPIDGGLIDGGPIDGDDEPRAAYLSRETIERVMPDDAILALLGLDREIATFAVDLSDLDDAAAQDALKNFGEFRDLRDFGGLMTAPEASLMAHARGLIYWHQRHRFCSLCGSPAEIRDAGHMRRCGNADCAAEHFPRTDPAVIMLVADGDRCLMGRQAEWPAGLYSTLAGFVEPGESLEEAVAREIWEEAGITVRDVRYHSSQPWPFPASLMLGFYATATSTEISLNRDELDDARWFHRNDLRNPGEGMRLPRQTSISRRLLDDWLAGAG